MKRSRAHGRRDRGFAIALLMWMIAGMSLLVTAVIHFAQDDIGLAEQRLSEARSEAVARGAALLILRDAALAPYLAEGVAGVNRPRNKSRANESGDDERRQKVFSQRYEFDGHVVSAAIHPASGFVSIAGGSDNELRRLFVEIGGAEASQSGALVSAVNDYRMQRNPVSAAMSDFLGFRAREELLAVSGMRKSIYDRIKDYVQPYEVTGLNVSAAPSRLRSVFNEFAPDDGARGIRPAGSGQGRGSRGAAPVTDGLVTFESLNRQKAAALAANNFSAILVDVDLESGSRAHYRIWVSGGDNTIVHLERSATKNDVEGRVRG